MKARHIAYVTTPLTVLHDADCYPTAFNSTTTTMAEHSHSRLEPFLLLARSTKGAAAAKVVLDATAAVSYPCVSDS